MFYESHQAEWVEGRMPKTDLLLEPQGKHSSPASLLRPTRCRRSNYADSHRKRNLVNLRPASENANVTSPNSLSDAAGRQPSPEQTIAPQFQSLVQRQLEALATQNFFVAGTSLAGSGDALGNRRKCRAQSSGRRRNSPSLGDTFTHGAAPTRR